MKLVSLLMNVLFILLHIQKMRQETSYMNILKKCQTSKDRVKHSTSHYVYNITKKADYLYTLISFYILEVIAWQSMNVTSREILMIY